MATVYQACNSHARSHACRDDIFGVGSAHARTWPHLKQVVDPPPDLAPLEAAPAPSPYAAAAPLPPNLAPGLARGGSSSHWKKLHCPSFAGLGQRQNILRRLCMHGFQGAACMRFMLCCMHACIPISTMEEAA